jgi:hypothetical protein
MPSRKGRSDNQHNRPLVRFRVQSGHSRMDDLKSSLPLWTKVALILDLVALVLSILGIFLWFPSYLPNIHVDHRGPTNSGDPFEVPFSVTNNGYFSVFNVDFSCRLNHVQTTRGDSVGGIALMDTSVAQELQRSATFDLLCPFKQQFNLKIDDSIKSANINIGVMFSPRLSFRRTIRCANFIAVANSHGTLDWVQRPAAPEECSKPTATLLFLKPSK